MVLKITMISPRGHQHSLRQWQEARDRSLRLKSSYMYKRRTWPANFSSTYMTDVYQDLPQDIQLQIPDRRKSAFTRLKKTRRQLVSGHETVETSGLFELPVERVCSLIESTLKPDANPNRGNAVTVPRSHLPSRNGLSVGLQSLDDRTVLYDAVASRTDDPAESFYDASIPLCFLAHPDLPVETQLRASFTVTHSDWWWPPRVEQPQVAHAWCTPVPRFHFNTLTVVP